jgi:hypothetical protein
MPTTAKTATILAGESLSDAVDISGAINVYVGTPTVWSAANVTFQCSLDAGVTWYDMFGDNENEVMLPMGGTLGGMFVIDTHVPKFGQVRLRSGPRRNPVLQKQDAVFMLYVIT